MNKINLEDLLLESLQSKERLCFRKQLYFGNNCYIVEFTLSGKNLTVKDVYKRRNKRQTFEKRCMRRWRTLRHNYLTQQKERILGGGLQSTSTEEFLLSQRFEKSSQTKIIKSITRSTLTQKMAHKFKGVQTDDAYRCSVSKAIQTTHAENSNDVGTQTKAETVTREMQAEPNVCHTECQTNSVQFNYVAIQVRPKTSTVEIQTTPIMEDEEETEKKITEDIQSFIYMLNEIGEMGMNHLILSQKNLSISRKIFELMEQMVNAQKLQYCILQPISKLDEILQKPVLYSESTQTECEMQDKQIQTRSFNPNWRWYKQWF